MVLILHCGKCSKQMRPLDPYKIIDDLYTCKSCYDAKATADKVKEFYENVDPDELIGIGYFGV